jgi:dsDNA-binding SOS-regulon protein
MLSKGNRDMHTTRSSEIPFIGSAFCAERTEEHSMMFREGEEAAFWDDAKECAEACQSLLRDEPRRQRMVEQARTKLDALQLGNEAVCARILRALSEEQGEENS